MKLVNLASYDSAWRGYEYYKEDKVISYEQVEDGVYKGKVKGSGNAIYNVTLDLNKVRNTSCDCPFANGRRIICKHAVALYFAIFPNDAGEYKKQVDKEQAEYEEWEDGLPDRVEAYVRKLSKKELQDQLLDVLFTADDWVLNRYIRHHDIDD